MLTDILQIAGGETVRTQFAPALRKMLRPFLKLLAQMCCSMYLDEHMCKDSSPGGAGVAIHLNWLMQLAGSFPTHCSN